MTEEERIAHCAQLKWAAQQSYKPAYAELGSIPAHSESVKEPWGELRLTLGSRAKRFGAGWKYELMWIGDWFSINIVSKWMALKAKSLKWKSFFKRY
jgi:hypothetical protein